LPKSILHISCKALRILNRAKEWGKRGKSNSKRNNKHRRVSNSLNTCIDAPDAFAKQKRDQEFREIDMKVLYYS